ncbi:hypothetical protein ThimaDRAFT_1658 [Thiocapsa marina 5811]|uniref:Uncharacterized protein n=1 Tax=Thiocapsa marina 5811 TaxID=768671 RepID=F9U9Q6_9GAMM|nr:hypothetical protein ThimaDRAFT_1658 [Thiocapsa marina 5811]
MERVAESAWNRWQNDCGMSGRMSVEYAICPHSAGAGRSTPVQGLAVSVNEGGGEDTQDESEPDGP